MKRWKKLIRESLEEKYRLFIQFLAFNSSTQKDLITSIIKKEEDAELCVLLPTKEKLKLVLKDQVQVLDSNSSWKMLILKTFVKTLAKRQLWCLKQKSAQVERCLSLLGKVSAEHSSTKLVDILLKHQQFLKIYRFSLEKLVNRLLLQFFQRLMMAPFQMGGVATTLMMKETRPKRHY